MPCCTNMETHKEMKWANLNNKSVNGRNGIRMPRSAEPLTLYLTVVVLIQEILYRRYFYWMNHTYFPLSYDLVFYCIVNETWISPKTFCTSVYMYKTFWDICKNKAKNYWNYLKLYIFEYILLTISIMIIKYLHSLTW